MFNIKKINNFLFSAAVIAFMFYIIKYPQSSTDIVLKGLNLCYLVIIPVIFPFLVFSRMFINSSVFGFLGQILNKPARFLFGVSGEYVNAFFIGGILGFPIGAKTVKEVYLINKNKDEAERTLAFCNNCSISFAISAAGIAVFGSFKAGFYLFIIQLISAIITGIIIKFIFGGKNVGRDALGTPCKKFIPAQIRGVPRASHPTNNIYKPPEINFTEIISESVSGILNICGTVLFFFIVTNVLFEYLKSAPFLTDLLNPEKHEIFSGLTKTLISGIFEISSGIYSLVNFNIPVYYKIILASVILSWTGISVHFQIMYILKDIGLSLKPYFTGKIIHGIISVLITMLAFNLLKITDLTKISETFAGDFRYYGYPPVLDNFDAYTAGIILTGIISLIMSISVIIAVIIFYLFEKSSKNRKKNVV